MSNLVKSKRYSGVYYRQNKYKDIVYFFAMKENGKTSYHRVGTKSEGITEKLVFEMKHASTNDLSTTITQSLKEMKSNSKTTFAEIANFYFDNRITRSQNRRKQIYELRLLPYFGNMDIKVIKPINILNFRNQFISKLAPHTINMYIELMSTIYNYYSNHSDTKLDNPTLKVNKLPVNNIRRRILSIEEIDKIFQTVEDDFMLTLFCSLSLCTAARKSTILNYKIKDINMSHRTLNSYDFKNQTSYISFIDDRTYNLLKYRLESGLYDTKPNTALLYVAGVVDLQTYVNRQLKNVFDTLFNSGLDTNDTVNRVVIHTFRHTMLSHLGMNGVSSHIIQKISNHKDIDMVNRYVKLNENSGKKEVLNLWIQHSDEVPT